MQIIGIDPGAVATGVAAMYTQGFEAYAKQFERPLDAWAAVEIQLSKRNDGQCVVLIEDYRSAGHMTKEAKATVGLVTFFKLAVEYYHWDNAEVVIRVEQHRLSGQAEAARIMGGTIDELKRDPNRKDAFSALAHCITYGRTLK